MYLLASCAHEILVRIPDKIAAERPLNLLGVAISRQFALRSDLALSVFVGNSILLTCESPLY